MKKLLGFFAILIVLIGLFAYFSTSGDSNALLGLAVGAVVSAFNFFLLVIMIKLFTGKNILLVVPIYGLRFALYLGAAYIAGTHGLISGAMFGVAVIAMSLSILFVYGIGGLRYHD